MDNKKGDGFAMSPLSWLLAALPVAVTLNFLGVPGVWVFVASCLAIIPLAGLMGRATEDLADSLGPAIGGLLNATFGNAAELIIALIALGAGKTELVKASITGSIIGNVLLVLGAAIVAGGFRYQKQTFNRTAAGLGATLLFLASIGLIFPSVHYFFARAQGINPLRSGELEMLSEEIAVILAVVYILSLIFTLRTHQHLFAGPECDEPDSGKGWSKRTAFIVLLAATAGVAYMSELLVHSVEAAAHSLGMNDVFIGVIVVAVIGNAAEHSTAVMMAVKNKMDLAITIAIGSSIQVALFVAPVLVFASLAFPHTLDLHFSAMELIAVVIAILVTVFIAQDGETHWMEGVLLLAVYVIIALAFYHLPGGSFGVR